MVFRPQPHETRLRVFPHFPVELITSDGELLDLGFEAPWLGSIYMVLSRERCQFALYEAPRGLKGRSAIVAARLHAQSAAPYEASGTLILRQGNRFGIWSWNRRWLNERLAAHEKDLKVRIVPETLFRHPMDGWRIVRSAGGYEAEFWKDNFLYIDTWRRRPFDETSWSNIARMASGVDPESSPPSRPPLAQTLPYTLTSPYRKMALREVQVEGLLTIGALAVATMLICMTLFFLGQALHLSQLSSALRAELAQHQVTSDAAKRTYVQSRINRLADLKSVLNRPDPLVLLQAAQKVIQPYGYKITTFSVDREKVHIILPLEAVVGVDHISIELESSPYFYNVHPTLDHANGQLIFDMMVRQPSSLKTKPAPKLTRPLG